MGSRIRFTVVGLTLLVGVGLGGPVSAQGMPTAEGGQPHLKFNEKLVEQGRYLAKIAGCNDCHTDGYLLSEGNVPEARWLTGSGFGWRGPWGTTYATNLRLFINALSEKQWLDTARHLKARPPMPWFSLNIMHETDLRALYHFIRYLGSAGKPAPAYVPPGQKPSTPFALFPPPPPPKAKPQ